MTPWRDVEAVLFDVNGTLVDISTDESDPAAYGRVAAFLRYLGARVDPGWLHAEYRRRLLAQLDASPEAHPEFDADALWAGLAHDLGVVVGVDDAAAAVWPLPRRALGRTLATLFRSATLRRLEPFPGTHPLLAALRPRVRLGVVTDGQFAHAAPELADVGLAGVFEVVVVSAEEGFRKPDSRLFARALEALGVPGERAVYVGNDPERDVSGARAVGMRTVLVPDPWAAPPRDPTQEPDAWVERIEDVAALLGLPGPAPRP